MFSVHKPTYQHGTSYYAMSTIISKDTDWRSPQLSTWKSNLTLMDRIPTFRRSSLEILGCEGQAHRPRPLGRGGFCDVYPAESRVQRGTTDPFSKRRQYAIKCLRTDLPRHKQNDGSECALYRGARDLASEAELLASLGHPNIVSIMGIVRDDDDFINDQDDEEYAHGLDLSPLKLPGSWCPTRGLRNSIVAHAIVLELLPETLEDRMVEWKKKSSAAATFEQSFKATLHLGHKPASSGLSGRGLVSSKNTSVLLEKIAVARQLSSAMRYLQDVANVVYRDLKPSNLGFNSRGNLKIFDFGLARRLPEMPASSRGRRCSSLEKTYCMTGCTGSLPYMAPEVALFMPYNLLADVYSYGIILWEIFSLCPPFKGMNSWSMYQNVMRNGHRPKISNKWPKMVSQLMRHCWAQETNERPDFHAVERTLMRQEQVFLDENNSGTSSRRKRSSNSVKNLKRTKEKSSQGLHANSFTSCTDFLTCCSLPTPSA